MAIGRRVNFSSNVTWHRAIDRVIGDPSKGPHTRRPERSRVGASELCSWGPRACFLKDGASCSQGCRSSWQYLLGIPLDSAHAQRYSTGITADYELIPNVTYLEAGAWQAKLDLYVRADTREPIPTLLFFHGGADDRGNKETELFNFLRYLEHGWNVVNVEHRLPGVTLAPAAMQNGICALRWVLRHANLYGFDVNKLVISGQSAGGWAALAVTMAGPALRADAPCAGDDEIKVAAVVNWYGVSDPVDL